jgi:hypothetical protein
MAAVPFFHLLRKQQQPQKQHQQQQQQQQQQQLHNISDYNMSLEAATCTCIYKSNPPSPSLLPS